MHAPPKKAVEAAAAVIEEMEGKYPERIIAEAALTAAWPHCRDEMIVEIAEWLRITQEEEVG